MHIMMITGAAFAGETLYPVLIGGDIGCGMSVYATSVKLTQINTAKWSAQLRGQMEVLSAEEDSIFYSLMFIFLFVDE